MHAGSATELTTAAKRGCETVINHICKDPLAVCSGGEQHKFAISTSKLRPSLNMMHVCRDLLLGGAPREDSEDDPDAIPGTAEQKRRLSDASAGGSGMLNPARPSRRSLNMDALVPVGEQPNLQGAWCALAALNLCILKKGRLGVWRDEALACSTLWCLMSLGGIAAFLRADLMDRLHRLTWQSQSSPTCSSL